MTAGTQDSDDVLPAVEQERISSELDLWLRRFAEKVGDGFEAYAYESVYIPVNSAISGDSLGEFDITSLQHWGVLGWQVVAVIPRTVGVGLSNSSGPLGTTSWGGGIGGNVAGVHVLLARKVSSVEDEAAEDLAEIVEGLLRKGRKL